MACQHNLSSLKKINGSLVKMKEEEQQENIIGVWERSRATAALWKGKHNNIRIVQYVFSYPRRRGSLQRKHFNREHKVCQENAEPWQQERPNQTWTPQHALRYHCEEVHRYLFCGLCWFGVNNLADLRGGTHMSLLWSLLFCIFGVHNLTDIIYRCRCEEACLFCGLYWFVWHLECVTWLT